MIKKTRTILFLVCLFLFLLIAPAVVLYSQGYRIDFDSKKITQTGGLFLKIFPKQVKIFVDGKLKEKTDFFFGSVLIENLLPKKYKVEVKKEGYLDWEKTLEIKEKEVTGAKNIVLFPENPDFAILIKGVKNFWFSPDQRKIILLEEGEKGWTLKLYELDKDVKSHLIDEYSFISTLRYARVIDEKDISRFKVDLLDLEFSADSKEISLEVGVAEQIKYFTLEIDKTPLTLIETEPPSLPLENIVTYQKFNNDIYYLDNFGHLFKVDERSFISTHRSARVNEEKLTVTPFPIKQEIEYILKIFQDFVFLQETKTLYQLNPNLKSFEKFFEPIKAVKISPDFKKLVYFSDYEIWILFLKDKEDQPQKKAGEKVFLMRLSEKIGDIFWLDSNYLLFNAGGKIKITELDERDKINVVELKTPTITGERTEIFWDKVEKRLYLLSNGNLYRSSALLP